MASTGKIFIIPSKRRKQANDLSVKVAADLNTGLTPEEIADRHINPKTGNPYTREHIYWVIRQLKKGIMAA